MAYNILLTCLFRHKGLFIRLHVDLFWSCRYEYSEEAGDDFDEEAITVTGSAVKVPGERKERKTGVTADHHVFGLGEDREEDKRE